MLDKLPKDPDALADLVTNLAKVKLAGPWSKASRFDHPGPWSKASRFDHPEHRFMFNGILPSFSVLGGRALATVEVRTPWDGGEPLAPRVQWRTYDGAEGCVYLPFEYGTLESAVDPVALVAPFRARARSEADAHLARVEWLLMTREPRA